MKRYLWILCFVLLGTAASPAWAGGFSLYGSYWDTADLAESGGAGLRLGAPVTRLFNLDLRAAYFPDLTDTLEDLVDNQGQPVGFEMEAIPVDAGLSINFGGKDSFNPYLGAGVSYFFLDSSIGEVSDEVGAYGVVGVEFAGRGGFGFFAEALYRRIEGSVDVDLADLRDPRDLSVVDEFDLDLGGLAVNAGVVWRW